MTVINQKANRGMVADRLSYNHIKLSDVDIEFINGELLGDGHLTGLDFICYYHSSKYRSYLEWLQSKLLSFGIEPYGEISEYSYRLYKNPKYRYKIYTSYRYYSKSYPELKRLKGVWYPSPEFKKKVPPDIELTPMVLRQWYVGDGSNGVPKGNGILLCIYGFSLEDKELLKNKMTEIGFHPNFQRDKNIIHIGMRYVHDFFNYIGSCPVECYKYKWNRYNYKGIPWSH